MQLLAAVGLVAEDVDLVLVRLAVLERLAGRVLRGEERIAAAPPPGIRPEDAARAVPTLRPPRGS